LGNTKFLPDLYRFLASAELAAGNLEAATGAAEQSVDYARAANVRYQEAATQRVLAEIAIARGKVNEARELLEISRQTLVEVGHAEELARTEGVLLQLR
jgi:ATP/maltotriose-dependent transcriptional regulator MalT